MRRLALVVALFAVLALPAGAVASGQFAHVDGPPSSDTTESSLDASASDRAFVDATQSATAPAQQTTDPAGEAPTTAATTEMTVQLRADGDARWHVETRYPLTSANETEAFRRYGERFERGEADEALDVETFEYLAGAASTVADRQMAIQNVSRSATVTDGTGVLQLTFTWTAFLSSDGDHLVLRDALRLPNDRTWLATLGANQQLVIETPPDYTINSTNAPVVQRSGSVVIEGPRTFETDGPLTIRYQPATGVAGYPTELIAGIAVAVVVILAVVVRRRQAGGSLLGGDTGPESSAEAGAASDGEDATSGSASTAQSSASDAGESASGTAGGGPGADESAPAAGAADATGGETEEPDLSLLSDEERVEHLIERNGGRMRQADIVDKTGWSDAKVSQLLSAMADEGRVEKLRLGRENLISLPEEYERSENGGGNGDDADGNEDAGESDGGT
jgi:uncharacterized membrane protein